MESTNKAMNPTNQPATGGLSGGQPPKSYRPERESEGLEAKIDLDGGKNGEQRRIKGRDLQEIANLTGISLAEIARRINRSTDYLYYRVRGDASGRVVRMHIIDKVREAIGDELWQVAFDEVMHGKRDPELTLTGKELRQFTLELGWSQEMLARRIGIARDTLRKRIINYYHRRLPLVIATTLRSQIGAERYTEIRSRINSQNWGQNHP